MDRPTLGADSHRDGAPFVDILAVLKQGADDGRACFPRSCAHYFETGKRGNPIKRVELASTMARLARHDRIALPHAVVPQEIRRALVAVFDLQVTAPEVEILGAGAARASAIPGMRYTAPAQLQGAISSELHHAIQRHHEAQFEVLLLADVVSHGAPEITRLRLHNHKNVSDDEFVREQNAVAAWLRSARGWAASCRMN